MDLLKIKPVPGAAESRPKGINVEISEENLDRKESEKKKRRQRGQCILLLGSYSLILSQTVRFT